MLIWNRNRPAAVLVSRRKRLLPKFIRLFIDRHRTGTQIVSATRCQRMRRRDTSAGAILNLTFPLDLLPRAWLDNKQGWALGGASNTGIFVVWHCSSEKKKNFICVSMLGLFLVLIVWYWIFLRPVSLLLPKPVGDYRFRYIDQTGNNQTAKTGGQKWYTFQVHLWDIRITDER